MEPFSLIIFGITSNLAQKYLLQALYDMTASGLLPEKATIVGTARKPQTREEFEDFITKALNKENVHHKHGTDPETLKKLLDKIVYLDGHLEDPNFYPKLKDYLNKLTADGRPCDNRIYYLATFPDLYQQIFEGLKQNQLDEEDKGWVRIMIEKPVGHDLSSAKELNSLLKQYFKDSQVYRLDHYLGKETIQNMLMFRFANRIFEPLMNSQYIDHIQISALEDFGIGDRGGYYDNFGALKDVGQNHQLQMLALATMDPPAEFTNEAITQEKIKLLKALKPLPDKVVFGQYEGYKQEPNVDPNSTTETYYALKTYINNDRLKDVPIYIRAGKKIGIVTQEIAEISIVFKQPQKEFEPNVLIYRIQPNEGIVIKILTKKPGHEVEMESDYMQFCYKVSPDNSHAFPDPYEKLILDVIKGDQTFFSEAEEAELEWAFIDPLSAQRKEPAIYKPGTWGPKEADELIEEDGRHWLEPSNEFCAL